MSVPVLVTYLEKFCSFYTCVTGLTPLENLFGDANIDPALRNDTTAQESQGLCSLSHDNAAWLELRMKFRASCETPQSHPPGRTSGCILLPGEKVMVGYWRASRRPDHFSPTGMLLIPSPNFAHALFDSKRTLRKAHWEHAHQFFPLCITRTCM